MKLSVLDLDLLVEAIDKLYSDCYNAYEQDKSPYNFGRAVDTEQLRKKIIEERQKRI